MGLKKYIDFAYSLSEMDEVQEEKFILPKSMTFELERKEHEGLQIDVAKEKQIMLNEFSDDFEVTLWDMEFRFIIKE